MSDRFSRKDFVKVVGTASAAAAAPAAAAEAAKVPAHPVPAHAPAQKAPAAKKYKPLGTQLEAYTYLTDPEQAFVEAAVSRLIPADRLGPGAKEAGVAYYIDQQLGGAFGSASKMYKQGPWATGVPTQGYQLAYAPKDLYRAAIAAANAYCKKTYNKTFDALNDAHKDAVLDGIDKGTIADPVVPLKVFFEMLLANTVEGFFADPVYGGNRDKIGWKLIGFPGVAAAYIGVIEKYNVPYKVEPVSIADVEQGNVAENHYPLHRMVADIGAKEGR